jgi:hypothetical protein
MIRSDLQQLNQVSAFNEQTKQVSPTPAVESATYDPVKTESAAKKGPDPFDLSKLVLTQSFAEAICAEEVISRIVIRKPNKQEWFRVHPDPEFRQNFGLIELKADNEFYFVHPDMMTTLGQFSYPATLYTYVDSTINPLPRLWPVRLPGVDGGDNDYCASARGIADYAMENWTQMWRTSRAVCIAIGDRRSSRTRSRTGVGSLPGGCSSLPLNLGLSQPSITRWHRS